MMLPRSPKNFSKEISILKHLAEVDMINIDVENMIRGKLIKVTLNRTRNLTHPHLPRPTKRNKFTILPLLQLNSELKAINFHSVFYLTKN